MLSGLCVRAYTLCKPPYTYKTVCQRSITKAPVMQNTVRKRNSEKTQQDILASARRQFSQRGFEAVGLRDIALDAGVNVALIGRYFGSKKKTVFKATPESGWYLYVFMIAPSPLIRPRFELFSPFCYFPAIFYAK